LRPPFFVLGIKNNVPSLRRSGVAWHGTCSLKVMTSIEAASGRE